MAKALTTAMLAASLGLLACMPARAAEPVRIGMISTFSGPQGLLGEEILNGFKLALQQRNNQLGGVAVALTVGDDQLKPDIGRQLAQQMLDRDHVDVITGILNSAVLLALARPVEEADRILISSNAAPSQLAGSQCHADFFSIAGQNDASPEAVGTYLSAQGVQRVFLLAPNYQAGKDKMAGFKRTFKGSIVGEVYTPFDQLDYAGEIAEIRRAAPEAVFEFLPGATGIAFLKQWHQSGVDAKVKLFADRGALDETMLAAVGDTIIGAATAASWSNALANAENDRFVAAYRAAYHRAPSLYAAEGYDTALLLDAALRKSGGKADARSLRQALLTAAAPSVRGQPVAFNVNHFPMDDYYLMTVAHGADGHAGLVTGAKILEHQHDAYAVQCHMAAE